MKNLNRMETKPTWLKVLFHISRIIIGVTFIFSGFVKGIDPLGSAYKFSDYFMAAHLPQWPELALVLSFLLSGAEFLIGMAMITGTYMVFTSWVALFFMVFFTILTLILAIFNPVSDCGCFGDAIKLTNWETFYKNVFFLILVVFIFIYRNKVKFNYNKFFEPAVIAISIICFYGISFYSYKHLPIIDFMPYSRGSNIIEKMTIPPGAPTDEYQTQLIYKNKNTGELKTFGMDNYPWQDTLNWQWVDTRSVLIKKGYTPPIHDFSISSIDGQNITDSILSSNKFVYLAIAYNLKKADKTALKKLDTLAMYCASSTDKVFYAVTASTVGDIHSVSSELHLLYPFYVADETMLKTVIRANPGLLLLYKGTIIGKWHFNDFNYNIHDTDVLKQPIYELNKKTEKYSTITFFSVLVFLITLLWLFNKSKSE